MNACDCEHAASAHTEEPNEDGSACSGDNIDACDCDNFEIATIRLEVIDEAMGLGVRTLKDVRFYYAEFLTNWNLDPQGDKDEAWLEFLAGAFEPES